MYYIFVTLAKLGMLDFIHVTKISYHGQWYILVLILTPVLGRRAAHCRSAHQHSTSPILYMCNMYIKRAVNFAAMSSMKECCVDSLVDIEGMVGLEQHCNIPPCPHHYLLHPPGVLGNKTAHIIHLSKKIILNKS